MKTAFDTDSILFALLNGKISNKGGVYVGDDRPEDSADEDVVVNTIDLPQDCLPQIGTSNINIYTADTTKKIKGKMQVSANRTRLKALTNEVLAIVRNAEIHGIKAVPGNMTIMYEPTTKQHFVNIRVNWNIQI
ncbi:hypothetical protein JCM6292_755 [Bacteroides pyogenes JCM 6292]|uniref:DUF3168 domain-containing protein n=2 Tax=Bacteroides pyogenes TaxID=310300 RepID=W4PEN8_9BACE|nr:hypothetical protein [Bacteroides pyogenes]GAE14595.1 hypothetical protein JCM6292_755 [Bacteroides pyogenes JCM 6292]GAE18232.1 hypothetical protein JCM6294_1102 [Bacteroides pyogenes DSM 20611 = JCM 6294]